MLSNNVWISCLRSFKMAKTLDILKYSGQRLIVLLIKSKSNKMKVSFVFNDKIQ